jgi:hypothetical protein
MAELALLAAALAGLAVAALAIRAYYAVKGLHQLIERVGRVVESEVAGAVRTLGETARGVQQTVGKLDEGLQSLANTLDRVDRLSAKLEPESLARTVVTPAVAKLATWIGGLRKGLASARGGAAQDKSAPGPGEGEEG